MLTLELLRQNAALAGVDDSILTIISEMSKNDENTVIGARIGELHGQYDTDVFGVTSVKKNDGEKSYDYTKRVLNSYKTQLAEASSKVTQLTADLANNSGDAVLQQSLKDSQALVSGLQKQLSKAQTDLVDVVKAHQVNLTDTHVGYAFETATSSIKFKAGIPDSVHQTLLASAKAEVLKRGTLDLVDNDGKKTVVVRDLNGNILNNPNNSLNPYTLSELIMETSLKDVIDTGVQQPGGGTQPIVNNKQANVLDLSGATTQIAADKAIEAHLLANGITRDSAAFADQSLSIRNENSVAELPIR